MRIGHVGQLSADNIKEANEHHIDVKAILISAPTLWRLPLNCIKGYSSKDFMDCTDVEERFKVRYTKLAKTTLKKWVDECNVDSQLKQCFKV